MTDHKHNGWRNYETWATALHIDNQRSTHDYWRQQARDAWRTSIAVDQDAREEHAVCLLAQSLRDEIGDAMPLQNASLYTDLLNAALSEVDYLEIAQCLVREIASEEESDSPES